MLSLLSWLIAGFFIGLIARALIPGKQSIGTGMTIVLGIVGAIAGGLLSTAMWPTWANDPDVSRMWPGWLMSIACASILLWAYVSFVATRSPVTSR